MLAQQANPDIVEKGENSLLAPAGTGTNRPLETVEKHRLFRRR